MRILNYKKRILFAIILLLVGVLGFANSNDELSSWKSIVQKMEIHLNNAYDLFEKGEGRKAYDEINTAYFRYYESKGMEKITMGYISGARKVEVENALYAYRKYVLDKTSDKKVVKEHKDELIAMLYTDAAQLDGTSNDKTSSVIAIFFSSFILVLREGLEAILVIAAIIAYLVKTGKKKYILHVYVGAIAGILASILLAVIFSLISGTQSGIIQEVFEGVGMFVAVIVLFYVSNWMVSKSETEAWNKYIKQKVETSVSTGNQWVLIFTAFIAVAREGAELILFFQGVPIHDASGHRAMLLAILSSALVLIVIFLVFRFLTVKLPLKPFFIGTSVLMYILCFSFAGKGVGEFQAAGVMSKTIVPWFPFEFDLLGIYPTYESLIAQLIVIIATVISIIWYVKRNKKMLNELKNADSVQ